MTEEKGSGAGGAGCQSDGQTAPVAAGVQRAGDPDLARLEWLCDEAIESYERETRDMRVKARFLSLAIRAVRARVEARRLLAASGDSNGPHGNGKRTWLDCVRCAEQERGPADG